MHVSEAANILGVTMDSNLYIVKKAYRNLSLKYHPDRNINKSVNKQYENTQKFIDVVEAYKNFSDYISNPMNEFITPLGSRNDTFLDPNIIFQSIFSTNIHIGRKSNNF